MKKAKGYIIYKYDPDAGKYKKIAKIEGKENRAWVDTSVAAGKTYHYKVAFRKWAVPYIYAKTHDGMNSSKIKVTVRY